MRAVVVKCEERIFDIVVEKTSGSLRLRFLVGCWAERRRSERLSSESEPSSEFVALAEEEEDKGHSSSASESDASEAFSRSTPPALVVDSLSDDDGDDAALGLAGLRFSAGTLFFLASAVALILRFLVKCDGIAFACFVGWLVCSVRLLVRN